MKFFIKTYGCKVNQYESQAMREQLVCSGYSETDDIEQADLCIVNTCTVTARADRACRDMLRRIIRENKKTDIIAAGCYIDADRDAVMRISPRIRALNNQDKTMLLKIIESPCPETEGHGIECFNITSFKKHSRAFIKVQDGCNNFCSYCIIPLVRGRSRSRDMEGIVDEIRGIINNGYKELVLTGICLGDFGKDKGYREGVAGLVKRISSLQGDFRIRLSSIEPSDITDSLINEMMGSAKLCRHLHVPLQSGDNDILRSMNRKYTTDDFICKIADIRSAVPDAGITTDVIVGFPGESESNFKNTLKTIEQIMPSRTHIFTYNPRPGTKAASLKSDVSALQKRQRYNQLKEITDRFSHGFKDSLKGKSQRVLVESLRDNSSGMLSGYTDTYIKVFIDGPDELMNKFIEYTI
jgi:threonylcarbamoyladenosine tRNA methylthiotransferase MtaB